MWAWQVKGMGRRLALLALALFALSGAGCLAAAAGVVAAGGAAAGYVYYRGSVLEQFPATMEQTWSATVAALIDLGMPVDKVEKGDGVGVIVTRTGTGNRVEIALNEQYRKVPADGPLTKVAVRVSVFGDRPLSERLLAQVQSRLANPAPVPVLVPHPSPPADVPPQTAPPPLAVPATN